MSKLTTITLATQTMFAELTQRALDAEFDELYDERGLFKRRRIKTREYWYYQRSVEGHLDAAGAPAAAALQVHREDAHAAEARAVADEEQDAQPHQR